MLEVYWFRCLASKKKKKTSLYDLLNICQKLFLKKRIYVKICVLNNLFLINVEYHIYINYPV